MFYALATSIVIELLMYIVYVLAIKDAAAVEANAAAPIEEIINQQAGPVVTKIVVAVALTNILACLLANILVATRLTYSMARDNMLPFSHVWRHVSRDQPHADLRGARTRLPVDGAAALRAGQREGVQLHPRHRVAGRSSSSTSCRPSASSSVTAGAPFPPASRARSTSAAAGMPLYVLAWWCSSPSRVALIFLPQFAGNKWVFLGVSSSLAASGGPPVCASRLSRGEAGAGLRQDPPDLKSTDSEHLRKECTT